MIRRWLRVSITPLKFVDRTIGSSPPRKTYCLPNRFSTMAEPKTTVKPTQFYRRKLPDTCIAFHSNEGKKLFAEALQAGHMDGYFGLAAQFRTQDEPAFCGLSTLVMILNTLEVDPRRVWKGPWRWYHETMLACCIPIEVVAKAGITLDQFVCLAACNTLNVNLTRGDDRASIDEFRETVVQSTRNSHDVVVMSYSRAVLSQTGDGHFSPIGGYHPDKDLVLMLDTARFKYPPHWVSLPLLFEAIKPIDNDTGLPRGYMVLSKTDVKPLVLFSVADPFNHPRTVCVQKSHERVTNFLHIWNNWLSDYNDLSEKIVIQEAINTLCKACENFSEDEYLLTTQDSLRCPKNTFDGHDCVIDQLVEALINLPMYAQVQNILDQISNPSVINRIGRLAPTKKSCHLHDTTPSDSCEERCCSSSPVVYQTAHLVTGILLAWPYQSSGANASVLSRVTTQQISKSNAALLSEIQQLRQQINTVMRMFEAPCGDKC